MSCEWFTFSSVCDIPNWLTLVIGGLIAAGLGSVFFKRQSDQSKRQNRIFNNRYNHAYASMKDNLNGILVESKILQEINQKYSIFPTKDLEEDYVKCLHRFSKCGIQLENICNRSSDVLEPRDETRIRRNIKFIDSLNKKATNNLNYDEEYDLIQSTTKSSLLDIPLIPNELM